MVIEMAEYSLKNAQLEICIHSLGAELFSIKEVATGKEYMWDARPEYWKRTSPVLFPIVGSLNGGYYRYEGKEYPLSQHGFARDMEFELISQTSNELRFRLDATQETLIKYPFQFRLEVGYTLDEKKVTVSWKVMNQDDKEMYFSIGGHPAFLCPIHEGDKQTDYQILFDTKDMVVSSVVGDEGTLSEREKEYALDNGYLHITEDLFDKDALVIEKNQVHQVSLCDSKGQPYLTVCFEAPLFGIWSPPKKNAPFICIEPWYGRCDKENFEGELSQREWGNQLAPSETFNAEYTIQLH